MPFNLPLPNMNEISIPAHMAELNSLTRQRLENKFYAPNQQANMMSKMAYANLMGPQFLAKLMGHDSIVANLPDDQKRAALSALYQAGKGQSDNNPLAKTQNTPANSNSFGNFLVDKIKNILGDDNRESKSSNPLAMDNMSYQDQQGINSLHPGESYVYQGGNQPFQPNMGNAQPTNSYAENVANYKGVEEEGKESGKIRANDIKGLNDIVFTGQAKQNTLDNLSNILSSQEFEKIRKSPIGGNYELSYYSKFGTPEQKNMIGQYNTLTGNIIKDSSRDFAGQFRKGEQQLLENMKPNPSDTVDAARGKTEALSVMNKMLTERARLTSEIMSKYHVNKLAAQEAADKKINGDQIRDEVHEKLNPKATVERVFDLSKFQNSQELKDWYNKLDEGSKRQARKQIEAGVF